MEKIRKFIGAISAAFTCVVGELDTMFAKYRDLMEPSDSQLQINSSNQVLLKTDPVYNSSEAPEAIKKAIATRTLQGFTAEEILDAYQAILHGDFGGLDNSAETSVLTPAEESPSSTEAETAETSLALIIGELDKVPTALDLDPETVAISGHTTKYLLRKCQEYGITLRQLLTMLDLKKEYSTNLHTIFSLMDQEFTFEEINAFLAARQILSETEITLTVVQIVTFQQRFLDVDPDDNIVAESIKAAFATLIKVRPHCAHRFDGTNMKTLLEIADHLQTPYLENVLDWLRKYGEESREPWVYPGSDKSFRKEYTKTPMPNPVEGEKPEVSNSKPESDPEDERQTDGVTDFTMDENPEPDVDPEILPDSDSHDEEEDDDYDETGDRE